MTDNQPPDQAQPDGEDTEATPAQGRIEDTGARGRDGQLRRIVDEIGQ